ncbi:molybdopterin-guanine dinucleotide biosynthesis protein B [Bacillus sp. NPDC077027]|uniref:molybdopterin-guanine dinucleotide biosynthesis protein B n=1 Tax=Bacillus sp. NPDC077027 TaxID=3390548 RepID=UPI003CFDD14E
MNILQIVGYQNSGKTTFIEKICKRADQNELKFGCLKHHGHGGKPDRMTKEKDSDRYLDAGALVAGVEGEGEFHLMVNHMSMDSILILLKHLPIDGILIEGYKQAQYPKIICARNEQELKELAALSNVQAAIYLSDYLSTKNEYPFPVFSAYEEQGVVFALNLLKEAKA